MLRERGLIALALALLEILMIPAPNIHAADEQLWSPAFDDGTLCANRHGDDW